MIKVLIVDDSRVMTRILSRILTKDPLIQVVGSALNGREAIERIPLLKPDVITLDVEMPVMDGIETLKHIMATDPIPVIMVSTLTKDHAAITMEALNMGACDFVTKDFANSLLSDKETELVTKVKDVARKRVKLLLRSLLPPERTPIYTYDHNQKRSSSRREIVSIGASTGGPPALQFILSHLPKTLPVPVVIAQHMPRLFTQSFAERLNNLSSLTVKEAEDKEELKTGVVLIAPGDCHMGLRRKGKQVYVELVQDGKYIYRPSVDLLMSTTASVYDGHAVGLILTGMGNDGASGMKEMKAKGAYIIAQDEETSVVYGMPKAVVSADLADAVLPIERIPEEMLKVL
jgi:two-component system, chemotaxis family, protein-glutamate methylesterase/glutaminase